MEWHETEDIQPALGALVAPGGVRRLPAQRQGLARAQRRPRPLVRTRLLQRRAARRGLQRDRRRLGRPTVEAPEGEVSHHAQRRRVSGAPPR